MNEQHEETGSKLWLFCLLAIILVASVIIFGFSVRSLWDADPASRSAYFDSFNILTATFSGLAFAGVIFAILLQRLELRLQRQELQATRQELRRSAEAQEQSQAALKLQVIALNETVRISQASLEPQVIVYAAADESRPTFILLIIENVGRGAAQNVRFSYPPNLPDRAWGIEVSDAEREQPQVMDHGPLATGIPFLPPGGTRKMAWGQYGGLYRALGDGTMNVTATFENLNGALQPPIESFLDVRSFAHTDAVDSDGARQSARHLEKIARDIGHISTGFRKPTVIVQSKSSHKRETARTGARMAEAQEPAAKATSSEESQPDPPAEVSEIDSEWSQWRSQ